MLRVGIPPPYPPLINDYNCFGRGNSTNGTILTFVDNNRNCRNNPGYSVELLMVLVKLLGYPSLNNVTLVSADGGGGTESGRGMVEMIGKGEIDVSLPGLAMTYERSLLVDYTSILYTTAPSCFMVCGTSNLIRMSRWGIVQRFFPTPYLLPFLFFTGVALWVARWVQGNIHRESSTVLRDCFESICDVVMVRETDRTSVGLLHNVFVSSVLLLVYLNGICAGNLVETFAPKRVFPFQSIQHLAEEVQQGGWRLRAVDGMSSTQHLVQIRELKETISRKPIARLQAPLIPEAIQSNDIVFDGNKFISSFIKKFRHSVDCMCDPLISDASLKMGSCGVSKSQRNLTERLSNAVEVLAASGILRRLKHKYFSENDKVPSTQKILGNNLSDSMIPVEVSLLVFYIPFLMYFGSLLLSIYVFLVEVYSYSAA